MIAATVVVMLAAVAVPGNAQAGRHSSPAKTSAVPKAAESRLVPKPAKQVPVQGQEFTLTKDSVIVAPGGEATRVAGFFASLARRSTGYPLPVRSRGPRAGNVVFTLAGPATLGAEGYRLRAVKGSVTIQAHKAEGLFRGVQTLRQLLPPKIESGKVEQGPWTVPGTSIEDKPRFAWRGTMLDMSRHFFTVQDLKRYIDLAALYKINKLHMHLSDDQGWRIVIDKWPRLATYGGSTEVGGGVGGYYTKKDFTEIVRYAAERYMTVVPEIDMPGHTNAALASYAELNCDGKAPPLYTGTDVGFSSLCVPKEITYKFIDDVIKEIAALSPGPYFHIGGDEAHSTKPEDYRAFIDRVRQIVPKHGKRMAGWQEIGGAKINPGSMAQFWRPAKGSEPDTETARKAVQQGAKLVMSPANRAYLDMKYNKDTPYGLTWAGLVEVKDSYSWDPGTLVDGIAEKDILGVEAPLWSETLEEIDHVEFMAYPRLPGIAELGWSPAQGRSWDEYRVRLGAQGARWDVLSVNFYRSPQVPWANS